MAFDDLSTVKDDMIAFIAGHGLRRMNAFVPETVPTVLFEEEDVDSWKDFVEHAQAAGVPFVTMSSVMLEPEDARSLVDRLREMSEEDVPNPALEDAEALLEHSGKTGYVQLGFSHGGAVYLFETATEWYDTFQELQAVADEGGLSGLLMDEDDDAR